jgi:outer membrane protein
MSKKEMELKQELLSNKQQQINSYQKAIQGKIQEEDQKASQTVINDINDYVKEYGKEHSYRIIFGASGSGNVMYADEASDLTDEILEGLNSEYKGE